jgi:hypothetical protein
MVIKKRNKKQKKYAHKDVLLPKVPQGKYILKVILNLVVEARF